MDVDDPAGQPTAGKAAGNRLAERVGGDQVNVEQADQVRRRQRVHAPPVPVTDVVYQDVDHSQGGDRPLRGVPVGDVERGSGDAESLTAQPLRRDVKCDRVSAVKYHPRARLCQATRHLQAQSAHRTGDQGTAPGKGEIRAAAHLTTSTETTVSVTLARGGPHPHASADGEKRAPQRPYGAVRR
jgi:hypothetical protein